jgi:hypothetical protein
MKKLSPFSLGGSFLRLKSTKLVKKFFVNRHIFSSCFSIIEIIKVETGDGKWYGIGFIC